MVEKKVKVVSGNDVSRQAALFVQTANKFSSNVRIKMDNKIINAKSLMGIISLGSFNSHDVIIITDGDDENDAAEELKEFLTQC